jgi:hypothetical protein
MKPGELGAIGPVLTHVRPQSSHCQTVPSG